MRHLMSPLDFSVEELETPVSYTHLDVYKRQTLPTDHILH